jgi:hypothetical protein
MDDNTFQKWQSVITAFTDRHKAPYDVTSSASDLHMSQFIGDTIYSFYLLHFSVVTKGRLDRRIEEHHVRSCSPYRILLLHVHHVYMEILV